MLYCKDSIWIGGFEWSWRVVKANTSMWTGPEKSTWNHRILISSFRNAKQTDNTTKPEWIFFSWALWSLSWDASHILQILVPATQFQRWRMCVRPHYSFRTRTGNSNNFRLLPQGNASLEPVFPSQIQSLLTWYLLVRSFIREIKDTFVICIQRSFWNGTAFVATLWRIWSSNAASELGRISTLMKNTIFYRKSQI